MAQFFIGFAAGIYVGTHYNCKPGLSFASGKFEEYFPKRVKKETEEEKKEEEKIKEKMKEKIKEETKEVKKAILSNKWF